MELVDVSRVWLGGMLGALGKEGCPWERVQASLLAEVSQPEPGTRFALFLTASPFCPPATQGDVSRAQECLMWIGRTESVGFWTSRRMRTAASFCGGTLFWHVTGFWPVEYPEWVEVMDTDSLFDP